MAKTQNSYSDKEIKAAQLYLDENPDCEKWGMDRDGETIWLPISMIKDDHLENIVKWIEKNSHHYSTRIYLLMKKELITRSEAGKILYGEAKEG
jgi:hypothetical protein